MTDITALIADNRKWAQLHRENKYQREAAKRMTSVLDALESTLAELRQALHDLEIVKEADWSRGIAAEAMADELRIELRRERKERAEDRNEMVADAERLIEALSRAEETIARIRVARGNHPECDVHDADDPVTCGWKRAVQDIDVALTDYDKQKEN